MAAMSFWKKAGSSYLRIMDGRPLSGTTLTSNGVQASLIYSTSSGLPQSVGCATRIVQTDTSAARHDPRAARMPTRKSGLGNARSSFRTIARKMLASLLVMLSSIASGFWA